MFTIDTEADEETCVPPPPHSRCRPMYSWLVVLVNIVYTFPRNVCRNAWEMVVL